jgi:hypothetical protein
MNPTRPSKRRGYRLGRDTFARVRRDRPDVCHEHGAGDDQDSRAGPVGRREVLTLYAIGLFEGLSLVALPAAATILNSTDGCDLSKSRCGVLSCPR